MVNPSDPRDLFPSNVVTMEGQLTEEEELNEALRLRYKRMSCTKDLKLTIKANLDVIVVSIALASLLLLIAIFAVVSHFASLKNPPPPIERSIHNSLSNNISNYRDIFVVNDSSHITDTTSLVGIINSGDLSPIESSSSNDATRNHESIETANQTKEFEAEAGDIQQLVNISDNATTPSDIAPEHIDDNDDITTKQTTLQTDIITTTQPVDIDRVITTGTEVSRAMVTNITENYDKEEDINTIPNSHISTSKPYNVTELEDVEVVAINEDLTISTNLLASKIVDVTTITVTNEETKTELTVRKTVIKNSNSSSNMSTNNTSEEHDTNMTQSANNTKTLDIDITTRTSITTTATYGIKENDGNTKDMLTESIATQTVAVTESGVINVDVTSIQKEFRTNSVDITKPVNIDMDITMDPIISTTHGIGSTESIGLNDNVTAYPNLIETNVNNTTDTAVRDEFITTDSNDITYHADINKTLPSYSTDVRTDIIDTTQSIAGVTSDSIMINTYIPDVNNYTDITEKVTSNPNTVKIITTDSVEPAGGKDGVTTEPRRLNTDINIVANYNDRSDTTTEISRFSTLTSDSNNLAGINDDTTNDQLMITTQINDLTKHNHVIDDVSDTSSEIGTKRIDITENVITNADETTVPFVITTQVASVTKPFDINGDKTTESNINQTVTEFESPDAYYDDPNSAWNSTFLPNTIRPVHYQLHLDIYVPPTSGPCVDSGMYTGSVVMTIRILTATDCIVFHANDLRLNADRVLILQSNVSVDQYIEDVTYNDVFEYYVIRLSEYLNEGLYDVIIPNFMGCITTSSELLLSYYKTPTGETR